MEKDKDGLIVKLSVTDMDIFQEVLNILIYSYEKLPESEKDKVYSRIDRLLGRDYAVDLMMEEGGGIHGGNKVMTDLQEKILNKLCKQIQTEIDIMGIQLIQLKADFEKLKANTEMGDSEKYYNIVKFAIASSGILHKINMISNLSTPYRKEINELKNKELNLSVEIHSYKNELAKSLGLLDWADKYKDILEGVVYD